MDLIDRGELMKRSSCRKNCEECDFFTDGDSWCAGELYGITVMQMPTVDAVPVVRCKDCKHSKPDLFYEEHVVCGPLATMMPCDGFCSFGKRKEETD